VPHVTLRTDPEVERVLSVLTEDGRSRSAVIREALLELYHQRLRVQAEKVAADDADLREMRAVQADMEPLRAW
jgi:Arc/MetJ-type ribon-helix-helix transcriptional regulator